LGFKIFILILLFGLPWLAEKNIAQTYYFRHYQVENGLSNNTVHCCLQDKHGFIWMGTKDGLDRFDGYSFKVFQHDEDDSTSIGSNFLKSIYQDKDAVIYVGTNNGLYRYNDSVENFTVIETGGEVRDIKRDSSNNLWYVIGGQLHRYDLQTHLQYAYPTDKYFNATSVCITREGDVWVSTADGFLERYDALRKSFTAYDVFSESPATNYKWIEKIYYTSHHSILIGTSTHGVKVFDIASKKCRDIMEFNPDKTAIFARDFIQTTDNEYWIATESGIFIYNMSNSSVINLKKQYNNPYSISDNAVYALCKDREGGIWAGTFFGGMNYFPKQYTAFKKYFPDYSKNSLSGNAVREISKDKYGNFWIGTEDAGLNKLDANTGIFTAYKPTGAKTDIAYSNIHGLLARGDELWIGTFEHGLDIMNVRTGKVIKHYAAGEASGLNSNFVVTIYQTKNGDIYTGTWAGLQKYDMVTDRFLNVDEVPPNFIYCIKEDSKGTLWVGTIDHGVYYFNPATKESGNLTYDPKNKNSIAVNFILDILEDSNKNMWFGTEGGGVTKFNRSTNNFKRYNSKTGFPSNTVLKILEDSEKKLWITTTRGLVHLDPSTDEIKVYTKSNGLLNDQFNYNSAFKDTDGTLYFGSVKGMISFNPDKFIHNNFIPPVYITGMQINNKVVTIQQKGSPLLQSITYTKDITLSYYQASFSIDFAALTYTAPEMTEYSYIMEGLDKDWTSLKSNRKVYFTDLSPGNYTFKVKAAGENGKWNTNVAALNIKILPPVWASTSAYVFYTIIALCAIYFAVRNYHQKLTAKNKRKIEILEHEKTKEIYEAKIGFFTNVAHEIRTPLTLIKAPMEKIIRRADNDAEAMFNLKLMEKNTNRLIDLTNQLLDFRKTETKGFSLNFVNTDINQLLQDIHSHFTAAAEQKSLSYTIELPAETVQAYVDVEALKKVLSNLISNALKFADSIVQVKLRGCNKDENIFSIEIKNDGPLIPGNLKEKIFEPFYRINEIEKVTGIGLALSKSLTDLHKGNLYLDKVDPQMNTFVLTLPVHQDIEFNLG
jgi:ligand-binding sensor domain-containing protein/signal transduction histidine kinase